MTTITEGALVEHTVWGRGKVLEVASPYLKIYFLSLKSTAQGPERKLLEDASQLSLSAVQSDPLLDNVTRPQRAKRTAGTKPPKPRVIPLNSVDQAISWFRAEFPGLFANPGLIRRELQYKRDAHAIYVDRFANGRGARLIHKGHHREIVEGLTKIYQATNIPSRFELMAANDGLKDPEAAVRLLERLLEFLERPEIGTFESLVGAVGSLPAPAAGSRVLTWPNVTILPFLADPSRFMVLKPGASKRIAARMGADIVYSSQIGWHTYSALLDMSKELLERLIPLGARDHIDVQSFMWVTRDLE